MIKRTIANELHAPARRNFRRRKVIMRGIDETWQADLVDMKKYSKLNRGYKYLLNVIDNVSKFAWSIPLKNKSSLELEKAFKELFKQGRVPKNLHVDQGTEFYNHRVKNLLKSHNVNLYSTFSEKKASIIERFNRSLKNKMWIEFSVRGSHKWIDILQNLVSKYNGTIHKSIRMKPIDVTMDDEEKLVKILNSSKYDNKKPKFKVGDHVRLSKYKHIFEKGYTPNWGVEIFTIDEVRRTNPTTYKLKDARNVPVAGGVYEYELLKVKYPDMYLIEKIVKKRGNQLYVKWLGFDSTWNSWIDKTEI